MVKLQLHQGGLDSLQNADFLEFVSEMYKFYQIHGGTFIFMGKKISD